MGTYTAEEFLDLFGGLPERDEIVPDLDAICDERAGAPCGGGCGPEGCFAERCPVGADHGNE